MVEQHESITALAVLLLIAVAYSVFAFIFFKNERLRRRLYEKWLPVREPWYAKYVALLCGIMGIILILFSLLAIAEELSKRFGG